MKTFTLPTGEIVMVDDCDYDAVLFHKWYHKIEESGAVYAHANFPYGEQYKRLHISLHRFIMDAAPDEEVDHIDGNGLNVTRANLRIFPLASGDNQRGFRRKHAGCISQYRGVSWDRSSKRWIAQIGDRRNGYFQPKRIGRFVTEQAAALAYNAEATRLGYLPEALNRVAA